MWGDKAMQLRSKETTNNKNRHLEESEIKNNSKWFLSDSNKISELEDKSKENWLNFPKLMRTAAETPEILRTPQR